MYIASGSVASERQLCPSAVHLMLLFSRQTTHRLLTESWHADCIVTDQILCSCYFVHSVATPFTCATYMSTVYLLSYALLLLQQSRFQRLEFRKTSVSRGRK